MNKNERLFSEVAVTVQIHQDLKIYRLPSPVFGMNDDEVVITTGVSLDNGP